LAVIRPSIIDRLQQKDATARYRIERTYLLQMQRRGFFNSSVRFMRASPDRA
jgi:hypothetical protein